MTTDLVPFAVYPWPLSAADAAALAKAGMTLNLPYRVKFVEAVIASPTRILALREAPPWIDDFRGTSDPQNDPELAQKMAWVLDSSIEDPKASLILDQLNAIMPGTVELFDIPGGRQSPEAAAEQRFADANRNFRRSLDSMVD